MYPSKLWLLCNCNAKLLVTATVFKKTQLICTMTACFFCKASLQSTPSTSPTIPWSQIFRLSFAKCPRGNHIRIAQTLPYRLNGKWKCTSLRTIPIIVAILSVVDPAVSFVRGYDCYHVTSRTTCSGQKKQESSDLLLVPQVTLCLILIHIVYIFYFFHGLLHLSSDHKS